MRSRYLLVITMVLLALLSSRAWLCETAMASTNFYHGFQEYTDPVNVRWDDRFGPPGMNDVVHALATDGSGNLYAGGRFTNAENVVVSHITKWDGTSWTALGSGIVGHVYALAVGDNGVLYAGGQFSAAGGVAASNVAMWDGTNWSPLGPGVFYRVLALAVDGTDNLYAGGDFWVSGGGIAKWDGERWSALESGVSGDVQTPAADEIGIQGQPSRDTYAAAIHALAVDDNGILYAGGLLFNGHHIAMWDGITWTVLGTCADASDEPIVNALIFNDYGDLYAGGTFSEINGVTASCIAKWDGASWSPLGSGAGEYFILNSSVDALAVEHDGYLYAGGRFSIAGGVDANCIARWDGSTWSSLSSGVDGQIFETYVDALAVDGNGMLYAGGDFESAGEVTASYIAAWDGAAWSTVDSGSWMGVIGDIRALAVGGDGALYAGGRITTAGGIAVANIAKWNGTDWEALGSGVGGDVYALAVDGIGNLFAGGTFLSAGDVMASNVAKWDGHLWSSLGSGVSSQYYSWIKAVDVSENGDVYVGGCFTSAGGHGIHNAAKWDGASWSCISPYAWVNVEVKAMVAEQGGNIYVAGRLSSAGNIAVNNIAMCDGTAWYALGSGVSGYYAGTYEPEVNAMALDGFGNLYVGGTFTNAGGVPASCIAKWDGTAWSALGSGISGWIPCPMVTALAVDVSGNLYAAGQFTLAGDIAVSGIAKWDGTSWSTLGSGVGGEYCGGIAALVMDQNGGLCAGGQFMTAGAKPSINFGIWHSEIVPSLLQMFTVIRTGEAAQVCCELSEPLSDGNLDVWREVQGKDREWLGCMLPAATTFTFIDHTPPPGEADYWLCIDDQDGTDTWLGSAHLTARVIPDRLLLSPCAPNPFNPKTTIRYALPQPGHVRLAVYNQRGRQVCILVDDVQTAGEQSIDWNGQDASDRPAASGVYFIRLVTEQGVRTGKMVLAR